ncbi:MAG: hypothetical protein JO301_17045 [Chitinophagaceae bacterium]|nr:hypothetical protein [Chitinophagaceae bacterium]
MKIIQNWIRAGRNFHAGAAIYKVIGSDKKLKTLFAAGKTIFAERALDKALTQILEAAPGITGPGTARFTPKTEIIPVSTDNVLEAIRQAWLPKYQRMNYLRHELDKYTGNSHEMIALRQPIAFEILQLEKECNAHWKEADEYRKTGQVQQVAPPDEMVVPDDPVAKASAIENCKRNIRRNRHEASKQPDKPGLADRYNRYKDFYFRLTGKQYQENV